MTSGAKYLKGVYVYRSNKLNSNIYGYILYPQNTYMAATLMKMSAGQDIRCFVLSAAGCA